MYMGNSETIILPETKESKYFWGEYFTHSSNDKMGERFKGNGKKKNANIRKSASNKIVKLVRT